jgi:hypothetical protein
MPRFSHGAFVFCGWTVGRARVPGRTSDDSILGIANRVPDLMPLRRDQKLLPHFGEAGTAVFTATMTKWNPEPSPTPDWDAKTVEFVLEAESLAAGPERIEALKKADQLCKAADIYRYVFSTELKPPIRARVHTVPKASVSSGFVAASTPDAPLLRLCRQSG